jgi:HAD superfamily hydrolase (TIGR01490 family)
LGVESVQSGVNLGIGESAHKVEIPPDAYAQDVTDPDGRDQGQDQGQSSLSTAAFFDLDNTLMRGSSLFLLARGLYRRGFFTWRQVMRFGIQQARFRLHGQEREGEIEGLRHAALTFVAGHSVEELEEISNEIFDESIHKAMSSQTISLARSHLTAGERVWLVTAAPIEAARVIAERLGFTGALGTIAEQHNGAYTGHLVGDLLHGPAKAKAVAALASTQGLDLARCSAYSDSSNDLPLLELVGVPYAINPDRALRRHAKRLGWQIYDFRYRRHL